MLKTKKMNIKKNNKIYSFIIRYILTKERDRRNIYFIDNQIRYISENCLNLLNSNISIEKDLRKRLDHVKLFLKKSASIKISKNIKRGILNSLKGQFI